MQQISTPNSVREPITDRRVLLPESFKSDKFTKTDHGNDEQGILLARVYALILSWPDPNETERADDTQGSETGAENIQIQNSAGA